MEAPGEAEGEGDWGMGEKGVEGVGGSQAEGERLGRERGGDGRCYEHPSKQKARGVGKGVSGTCPSRDSRDVTAGLKAVGSAGVRERERPGKLSCVCADYN